MNQRFPSGILVVVILAAAVGTPECLLAGDPPPQRVEQLEFDPGNEQWIEIPPPQPGTPEGDLAIASRRLAEEEIGKARKAFKKWFKDYGEGHLLARQAKLGLAEVELADENYYKAHKILEILRTESGPDEIALQAADWEFVVAEVFLSGKNRKLLGMRLLRARDLGVRILDDIFADYPDTDLAESALKTKADYYFKRGDFDLAEDEYSLLIARFPRSRWLLWAYLRSAQAALARFPGTQFDDASLVEAEERFLRFRSEFPQGAEHHDVDLLLEDIRNTRGQKELETGQYYARVGQPAAAAFYFRSVIDNWPGTVAASRAEAALIDMGQMHPPTEGDEQVMADPAGELSAGIGD